MVANKAETGIKFGNAKNSKLMQNELNRSEPFASQTATSVSVPASISTPSAREPNVRPQSSYEGINETKNGPSKPEFVLEKDDWLNIEAETVPVTEQQDIPTGTKLFQQRMLLIPKLRGMLTYTWSHLNCQVRSTPSCWGKTDPGPFILHHVSGVVKSGELWALMGANGAGKTTLLNILNFRAHKSLIVTGDRCINGSHVGPELVSSISAYVHQDDIFYPLLTVREHLVFSSLMRLPADFTKMERHARIDEILHELGLWDIRNSYIGSPTSFQEVSVGERKRLAFGAEILTDPAIMFCDEPTTGLDTFMAQHVIEIMHKMVASGKIIICTIHQPTSEEFAMFDNVYLMAEGRMIYAGSRNGALDFFAQNGYACPLTHNPADYYLRIMEIKPDEEQSSRIRTEYLANAYRRTDNFIELDYIASLRFEKSVEMAMIEQEYRKGKYVASCCAQFKALVWRTFLLSMREPILRYTRMFPSLVVGFFLAMIYYRIQGAAYSTQEAASISGLFTVCTLLILLLSYYAVVCTFTAEIPIFLREHWNGMYRPSAYFLAKTVVDVPFFSVFPFIFFPQIWWLAKLEQPITHLFSHMFILFCVSNTACSLGYCVSTYTRSMQKALNISTVVILPNIILCGAFLIEENLPDWFKWANFVSMAHLGNENMMILQWQHVKKIQSEDPLYPGLFSDGRGLLAYYHYEPDNFINNFIVLGLQFLLFRICAYIGLYRKTIRG